MRYLTLLSVLTVSLLGQQPDCSSGSARDVDARCACVKDPNSQLCDMVKRGFYEPHDWSKAKPLNLGWGGSANSQTGVRPASATAQPARPPQARVVSVATKDYLRFLHPNAQLVAGFDFEKLFRSPELLEAVFGQAESDDARNKMASALKEMDHLWLSFVAPNDLVLVTTGKFEQGAVAGIFYAQGVRPVFLGGAHAMMVGSEPSIQAALARLAKAATNDGWATRRARELAKDHETWIVNQLPAGARQGAPSLRSIRQFAIGFRVTGDAGIDGEAVTDSEPSARNIAAWIEQMKSAIREKTGAGVLDSLTVKYDGAVLRFAAKGDTLLAGDAGRKALNSDLGVELYGIMMAGFPGMPPRTVAGDKLLTVWQGMKREELLGLLGQPLSVSSIQGLDTPRETWSYQVAFGKLFTVRLDGGIVSSTPH